MKKIMNFILSLTLFIGSIASFSSCGNKRIQIAVPNDTTNEARALLLLQENGIITLKEGAGITATKADIISNPYNIEIVETEAAQIPNILRDVDYAVINGNYALQADINPKEESLAIENIEVAKIYQNILCVKEGNENTPKIKALVAALTSQAVVDYITNTCKGAYVSTIESPVIDGYDPSIDYSALSGNTITIAASPTPHAEILKIAKNILSKKNITLAISEYQDYIIPNTVVEDLTVNANYFQHLPYLNDFNKKNNTHIVSVAAIHTEPMGLYGGKQKTLDKISAKK